MKGKTRARVIFDSLVCSPLAGAIYLTIIVIGSYYVSTFLNQVLIVNGYLPKIECRYGPCTVEDMALLWCSYQIAILCSIVIIPALIGITIGETVNKLQKDLYEYDTMDKKTNNVKSD